MAPPTKAQKQQWDEDGYLVLEGAMQGVSLERLQQAFNHWAAACKEDWLERIATGDVAPTFYDIPAPLEKDDAFLDLVDYPAWFDLLQDFTDGELLFLAPQVRTVPLWPVSYAGWHPDVGHTNPLHIKVQIYVNDVPPGGGEFGYVPGSHKKGAGPYFRPQRGESMPGHQTFPGPAGTAIVFNSYGWHTAMDNCTDTPRKSIILIYEKRTPEKIKPEAFAAIAPRCTTPERRALLGLEI
jgi:hypothetical protein